MQENTITVSVDVDGVHGTAGANAQDVVLTRHSESENISTYIVGGSHSLESRHQVQLYRSFATPSGDSRGSDKTKCKITVDREVANRDGSGNITKPEILEINHSIPRGVPAADTMYMRELGAAILRYAEVMASLDGQLEI